MGRELAEESKHFGEVMTILRTDRHLTLAKVAEMTGLNKHIILNIEKNACCPKKEYLEKINAVYGTNVYPKYVVNDKLVGGSVEGDLVRKTRCEKNITQTELANAIGVRTSAINLIERGKSYGSKRVRKAINDILGLDLPLDDALDRQKRNTYSEKLNRYCEKKKSGASICNYCKNARGKNDSGHWCEMFDNPSRRMENFPFIIEREVKLDEVYFRSYGKENMLITIKKCKNYEQEEGVL